MAATSPLAHLLIALAYTGAAFLPFTALTRETWTMRVALLILAGVLGWEAAASWTAAWTAGLGPWR